jgi:hypothetical protein
MKPRMKSRSDAGDLHQLALLDPVRGREPSAQERVRARADLERTMALPRSAPIGRTASTGLSRLWFQRLTVAGALLGTAGVATAVVLITQNGASDAPGSGEPATRVTSGPDKAVTPRRLDRKPMTRKEVLKAGTACAKVHAPDAPSPLRGWNVLLAEPRQDTFAEVLMQRGDLVSSCTLDLDTGEVDGKLLVESPGWLQAPKGIKYPDPTGGSANVVEAGISFGSNGFPWMEYSTAIGKVGDDVTGVDIVLKNGTTVPATVGAGWWTAWWPDRHSTRHEETQMSWQVAVHTRDGRTTLHRSEDITVDKF